MLREKMPALSLNALAEALQQFHGRYQALDFFIADVPELEGVQAPTMSFDVPGLGAVEVVLHHALGVGRMTKKRDNLAPAIVGGLAGAATSAALSKPSEGAGPAVAGFLVGMLVGAALSESAHAPRRILAIRYDPTTNKWNGYDGGLVPYMKQWLAHPSVIGDLPK